MRSVHWPTDNIRERYIENCYDSDVDWSSQLADFLDVKSDEVDGSAEAFWSTVDTNLRAGKIRLVIVADVIPRELGRIVEFLNLQMNPAEVFAIEIKQYVGADVKTLVPKLIGQTVRFPPGGGKSVQ